MHVGIEVGAGGGADWPVCSVLCIFVCCVSFLVQNLATVDTPEPPATYNTGVWFNTGVSTQAPDRTLLQIRPAKPRYLVSSAIPSLPPPVSPPAVGKPRIHSPTLQKCLVSSTRHSNAGSRHSLMRFRGFVDDCLSWQS